MAWFLFSTVLALNALLQPDPLVWVHFAVLKGLLWLCKLASKRYPKYEDELDMARYVLLNSVLMLRIPFPWILFAFQALDIFYSVIPSIFMSCFVANLSPLWALWFATLFSSIFFAVEYCLVRLTKGTKLRRYTDGTNVHMGYIHTLPSGFREIESYAPYSNAQLELNGFTLCLQLKKKPAVPHEDDTTEDDEWHLEQATSMSSDAEVEKLDLPELEEPKPDLTEVLKESQPHVNGKEEADQEFQKNGKEEAEPEDVKPKEPKQEDIQKNEDEENIKAWIESRSRDEKTQEEIKEEALAWMRKCRTEVDRLDEEEQEQEQEQEKEKEDLPDYLHPRMID